jgi:hypothetical protein
MIYVDLVLLGLWSLIIDRPENIIFYHSYLGSGNKLYEEY